MNKLEFSSVINSFVESSETIVGGMVFCQGFPFRCISNCCFYWETMHLHTNKVK
jgi:hypothetical protein